MKNFKWRYFLLAIAIINVLFTLLRLLSKDVLSVTDLLVLGASVILLLVALSIGTIKKKWLLALMILLSVVIPASVITLRDSFVVDPVLKHCRDFSSPKSQQAECVASEAVDQKDVSLCLKGFPFYDNIFAPDCIDKYVAKTGDAGACQMHNKILLANSSLKAGTIDQCLSNSVVVSRDTNTCQQITSHYRNDCYYNLAIVSGDSEYCRQINGSGFADSNEFQNLVKECVLYSGYTRQSGVPYWGQK